MTMVRDKHIATSKRLRPVDLRKQLLPGTIEHALNHLLDHEIGLRTIPQYLKNTSAYADRGMARRCRAHLRAAYGWLGVLHFTYRDSLQINELKTRLHEVQLREGAVVDGRLA